MISRHMVLTGASSAWVGKFSGWGRKISAPTHSLNNACPTNGQLHHMTVPLGIAYTSELLVTCAAARRCPGTGKKIEGSTDSCYTCCYTHCCNSCLLIIILATAYSSGHIETSLQSEQFAVASRHQTAPMSVWTRARAIDAGSPSQMKKKVTLQ